MTETPPECMLRSLDATWNYECWQRLSADSYRYEVIGGVLYRSSSSVATDTKIKRRAYARAGLSKAELARRAEVSKYTLQKKTSGDLPRTRGAIAWRLARAYAKERGITDEQAMLELFEETTENTTPALAVA